MPRNVCNLLITVTVITFLAVDVAVVAVRAVVLFDYIPNHFVK
jgi:hypothetical protein